MSAESEAGEVLVFDMVGADDTVRVVLNLSGAAIDLPDGALLLASEPVVSRQLPAIAAAWVRRPPEQGLVERLGSALSDLTASLPGLPGVRSEG